MTDIHDRVAKRRQVKKWIAAALYTCRRFAADDDPTPFSWDWRPRLLLVAAARLNEHGPITTACAESFREHGNKDGTEK